MSFETILLFILKIFLLPITGVVWLSDKIAILINAPTLSYFILIAISIFLANLLRKSKWFKRYTWIVLAIIITYIFVALKGGVI